MSSNIRMISSRERWINEDGTPSSSFFRLMASVVAAVTPGAAEAQTLTGSPFTITIPPFDGTAGVIVQGGTVSKVEFGRDGTFYNTGATQGLFGDLHGSDQLRITYSVAPTVTLLL